jgi:hypothetical protein
MNGYFNKAVSFTVDISSTPEPELFSSLVTASIIAVAVVGAGLGLPLYLIKRK